MRRWIWTAWCGVMLFAPPVARAQVIQQVIQLPTFHVFSVGTTVVVPDRGSILLGGVDRASYGRSSFGVPGLSRIPGAGRLFSNRAIGSDVSSSRAYATATILDMDELDRAVLREAAERREAVVVDPIIARKAEFLTRHVARPRNSLGQPPERRVAASNR